MRDIINDVIKSNWLGSIIDHDNIARLVGPVQNLLLNLEKIGEINAWHIDLGSHKPSL